MRYKIRPCKINNDGTVTEGKRTQLFITPQQLQVGGIYNLRPGRFYRVIEWMPLPAPPKEAAK